MGTPAYIPSMSQTAWLHTYEAGCMRGFQIKNKEVTNPNTVNEEGIQVARVRLPKKWNKEQFALADMMMGANHIRVRCIDGITRLGRIKGTLKKRVWIREGDTLIVAPWSFQDAKCDILFRYVKPQTDWLKRNHYL
jgi:translation initiation factor 1A